MPDMWTPVFAAIAFWSVLLGAVVVCVYRNCLLHRRRPPTAAVAEFITSPDLAESDEDACAVCLVRKPICVLRPCHHTLCPLCAVRVSECPLCRAWIETRALTAGVTEAETPA